MVLERGAVRSSVHPGECSPEEVCAMSVVLDHSFETKSDPDAVARAWIDVSGESARLPSPKNTE
jgi:hypothetical protein